MKKFIAGPSVVAIILLNLLLPDKVFGNPRSQVVQIICGSQLYHNTTIAVSNFVATFEKLSGQMRTSGSGIAVTSLGADTIYGLGQCYGDLSSTDCVLCYAEARTMLPQCFPSSGGRIFLDGCFLRAENYSFFQEYTGSNDSLVCGNRTRKNSAFRVSTRQAVERVVSAAPDNNSHAQAYVPVLGAATYVIADCWRTLSSEYCRACLENASASIMRCLPWSEGRALNAGCFMRYSDTNFLNSYPEQKNGSRNSTQGNEGLIPIQGKGSSRGRTMAAIVATVCSIAVLVIAAVIGFYIRRLRTIQKKRKEKLAKPLYDSRLDFKYSTLEKATSSFDEAHKLGQGGFGTVYKGVLPDGREIAVKRLFLNKKHRAADFYNEVNIISCIEHKNLVRLLGCSFSGPESLLVYEFLPNKSLDFFIFDPSKGKGLNWEKRFEIITGIAEGLVYLHENLKSRIIHRDIKASNILLDSRFRAKIADFGLARSFQEDKSHISTAIAGTLGYMAPEYIGHGQLTEKADVYSFGVLVIEIVTGRQNNRSKDSEYSDSSLTIAWKHFKQRTLEEIFDPSLMLHNHHNVANIKKEIVRVVHIGLLCTQEIPSLRPSMSRALDMLVEKEEQLPTPSNPPYTYETIEPNDIHEDQYSQLEHVAPGSVASTSHSIFYPR